MTQRSDVTPLRTRLLSGSTLKSVPFSPFFLSVLLHLQSLSLALLPFLSHRLSLTAPPCPWLGYVSQSWGKGVRISAAALPCTPAHVLSLKVRQRGRERWREKQGSCWWCRQKQCLHRLKVGKLYQTLYSKRQGDKGRGRRGIMVQNPKTQKKQKQTEADLVTNVNSCDDTFKANLL